MNKLKTILGDSFKPDDYGFDAYGEVKSGKPLTQRRIQAVCKAAKEYAAKGNLDDVKSLFGGKAIGDIFAGQHDQECVEKMKSMAKFAAKVRDGVFVVKDGNNVVSTPPVKHGGFKFNLSLDYQKNISVNCELGGKSKWVGLNHSPEDVMSTMDKAIIDLWDSFPEPETEGRELSVGRRVIWDVLNDYEGMIRLSALEGKKECSLMGFAGGLLKAKAGVTDEQIAKLTNKELSRIAKELCKTGDLQAAKDAVIAAGERDAKFNDVAALLNGKTIDKIIGDDHDDGWQTRAVDLAALADKVKQAAEDVDNGNTSSIAVTHGDVTVSIEQTYEEGMTMSVKIGDEVRKLVDADISRPGQLINAMKDFADKMADFAEKANADKVDENEEQFEIEYNDDEQFEIEYNDENDAPVDESKEPEPKPEQPVKSNKVFIDINAVDSDTEQKPVNSNKVYIDINEI